MQGLQADMQLVQDSAVLVIEHTQQQLVVVLLQPRAMHVGKEAGFFVDTGRMAAPAPAAVVEQAPGRQIGPLERAQGDRCHLQLQQMAARHRAQRGEEGCGVRGHHPRNDGNARFARPFKRLQKRDDHRAEPDSVQA